MRAFHLLNNVSLEMFGMLHNRSPFTGGTFVCTTIVSIILKKINIIPYFPNCKKIIFAHKNEFVKNKKG